ncbi:MAG TPA: hypothetical protein VFV41_17570, partial [Streptosporangiaceae bacterium]|nr:hypothetical protein [Streptosporangiaceae bacterium]
VSGTLPAAATALPPGPGARHGAVRLDTAVTTITASRLGLHVGSQARLKPYLPGRPEVILRVTGIVAPRRASSAFWQADTSVAAPIIPLPHTGPDAGPQYWQGTALIGPGELTALQAAYAGSIIHGQWFLPLIRGAITSARLPQVLAGLNGLATTNGSPALTQPLPAIPGTPQGETTTLTVSSAFPSSISGFAAQQRTAAAIGTLLIADVLLVSLFVVVSCARLAAGAYRPELTLIRARGGSARQVAGRVLARSAGLAGPGAVAGAAIAVAITAPPPGGGGAAWALGGLAAAAAIGIPALAAGWTHRGVRPAGDGRADLAATRPTWRRLTGELTVLALAGAALAMARLRGVAAGADVFIQAAPVLAAAAAALIAARLYPVPVRGLLRLAAGRRGVVGFLAVARTARARIGALLPALTLVISLTVAALGFMIAGSVAGGQSAAVWRQAGADVLVRGPGPGPVPAAFSRALATVPGVRHVAPVYAVPRGNPAAGTLRSGSGPARAVGLVVVSPGPYAALAGDTPWPGFPAGALARGPGSGTASGVIPVLAPAGLGAVGSHATLEQTGVSVPVRIAGRSTPTPAMPSGRFVVLPAWATSRLPSVQGPDEVLLTGAGISTAAIQAQIRRHLPGAQLVSRARILTGLRQAPALHAAARLYWLGTGVAALLSVIALLFALAVSGQDRGRLASRLLALGTGSRQARAVAVTEVVPLLAVAVLGSFLAALLLAVVLGPVLNLAVFSGAAGPVVLLRPDLMTVIPAAGIVVLALAIVSVQSAAFLRRNVAAQLRQEEAG